MVTFPQITLDFNHKIKISNDSDTGEHLFQEFEKNGRRYYMHSSKDLLHQKIFKSSSGIPKMKRQMS